MIADIMSNIKFQAIIKELFIKCRKLNISLVFITQSYFSVPKDMRLNSTHYFILKINNRKEWQNIATNHYADIDYNDFVRIYREFTRTPYSFFTINTTLPGSTRERNILMILRTISIKKLKNGNNYITKFIDHNSCLAVIIL